MTTAAETDATLDKTAAILDRSFQGHTTMDLSPAEVTEATLAPVEGGIKDTAKPGTIHQVDPRALYIVGLDGDETESHPLWDDRIKYPVLEALVASIAARGVISPVTVKVEDGKTIVIDGRQRVRAAREAQRRLAANGVNFRIPCVVVAAKKGANAAFIAITLNAIRQQESFAGTAKKAAALFALNKSYEETALAFGISVPVAKRLIFFGENAGDALHAAVSAGQISPDDGLRIARSSEAAQEETVAQITAPVAAEAAAQGVTEGKAARARGVGERGRPTGKSSKGVKHSTGRQILKKGAETCPDPGALALLRWIFEGTSLPKDHPLAKWVGKTMKAVAEKGTPGRPKSTTTAPATTNAAPAPAAAAAPAASTEAAPAKRGPGRPRKVQPAAPAAAPAAVETAPAAAAAPDASAEDYDAVPEDQEALLLAALADSIDDDGDQGDDDDLDEGEDEDGEDGDGDEE